MAHAIAGPSGEFMYRARQVDRMKRTAKWAALLLALVFLHGCGSGADTQSNDPPATCALPQPADLTQAGQCPTGTTGSWTQRKAFSCVGTTWTPAADWSP